MASAAFSDDPFDDAFFVEEAFRVEREALLQRKITELLAAKGITTAQFQKSVDARGAAHAFTFGGKGERTCLSNPAKTHGKKQGCPFLVRVYHDGNVTYMCFSRGCGKVSTPLGTLEAPV